MGCSISMAEETSFIGPENLETFFGFPWSDASNWTNGVPGSEDDAIIAARRNENGVVIGDVKANLDVNVTVASLSAEEFTTIRADNFNLFVTGTSSILGELAIIESQVSLGDFAQFDSETKTLNAGPNIVIDILNDPRQAILEFRGANIVSNFAFIQLFGPDESIIIRDQNTGISAFQNFANNHSFFSVNNGYFLRTTGNFTNHPGGTLTANYRNFGDFFQPPAGIQIAGNLLNEGTVELYSNSSFSVAGGVSGNGSIKVLGLPCNLNVLANFDLDGGNFNLGGSGIDGFILKAQNVSVTSGGTFTGNGTVQAGMTVSSGTIAPGNSTGAIKVDGDLTLQSGSTLKMEIGGTSNDIITQTGGSAGVTLGGALQLSTIANFDDKVLSSSTYTILDGTAALAGAFSNVASGARLTTTTGKGSFRVDYGAGSTQPDKVILSDYIATNVPETFAQWIVAQGVVPPDDGPEADPNRDGISNLEAYFRGIPAKGGGTLTAIGSRVAGGNLVVTLHSARTVTGVTLTSSTNADLGVWQNGPVPVLTGTTPTRNIFEVTIPVSAAAGFVRFNITRE